MYSPSAGPLLLQPRAPGAMNHGLPRLGKRRAAKPAPPPAPRAALGRRRKDGKAKRGDKRMQSPSARGGGACWHQAGGCSLLSCARIAGEGHGGGWGQRETRWAAGTGRHGSGHGSLSAWQGCGQLSVLPGLPIRSSLQNEISGEGKDTIR